MPSKKNGQIHFHTPPVQAAAFPYQVLAAGETRARVGMAMIRQRFYQHVFILTLEGGGQIETGGRRFLPGPDTLVWLDTSRQYAHGCRPDCACWHYLWVGFRGFGLDDLWLGNFSVDPVLTLVDRLPVEGHIQQIIARLAAPDGRIDALNSAAIAQLIACLFAGRNPGFGANEDSLMAGLIGAIRQDLIRPWRIETLAQHVGLSPAQLHRRFRMATGTAPMAWIRHERINSAKPALAGSAMKIASIALSCGYSDPYHFSRDFKRVTGVSPIRFRREGGI